jgi:Lrp/AsnC family leucine-responsive transcriptional regulator
MDRIDQKIAGLIQANSQRSNAEIARHVGVSVSTANERLRKLTASGAISAWRGVLDSQRFGAGLCAFVFVDTEYEGEDALRSALTGCPEVQELHHVSGSHSYLVKIRVADTAAMQAFLQHRLKRQPGVRKTESIIVLETVKETTEIAIAEPVAEVH